jgi:hypothetical protein
MNYILALQSELSATRAALRAKDAVIEEFRCHLAGSKFQGLDLDGARKDWIATGDVRAWLQRIADADGSGELVPACCEAGPP